MVKEIAAIIVESCGKGIVCSTRDELNSIVLIKKHNSGENGENGKIW